MTLKIFQTVGIFTLLIVKPSFSEESLGEMHNAWAQTFYGQFTGTRINHFVINDLQSEKMEQEYQGHLNAGLLPSSVSLAEVKRYVDSLKEPQTDNITYIYARSGDKDKKTFMQHESADRPWDRVNEDILNGNTRISLLHDFKFVHVTDDENTRNIHRAMYFNPCGLLYPFKDAEPSSIQVSAYDQQAELDIVRWDGNTTGSEPVSIESILDRRTGLPVKTLLIQPQPVESTLRIILCEFSDYRENQDRMYPRRWKITVWSQSTEAAYDRMTKEDLDAFHENKQNWILGPQVHFRLENIEEFYTLPFMHRYELELSPLDTDVMVQEEDTFFWAKVDEGYRYHNNRIRNRETLSQYNASLANRADFSDDRLKIMTGVGPYTLQP